MTARPGDKTPAEVWVFEGGRSRPRADELATEEPLEIRLGTSGPPGGKEALRVLQARRERAVEAVEIEAVDTGGVNLDRHDGAAACRQTGTSAAAGYEHGGFLE